MKTDYSEMTIQQMLRAYNTLVADAQLAGLTHYRERRCFKDRSDAEKSLAAIASSMKAHKEGQRRAGGDDISPGLARLRADPRAERLCEEVLQDQAEAMRVTPAEPPTVPQEPPQAYPAPAESKEGQMAKAKKAKKEGNGSGRRGRAPAYGDEAKITVLAEGNPKREGTKAHEWFAAYRTGIKVATLCEKLGRSVALGCLRWDVEKGYVAVE
jgi:hypothetical protein